MNKIANKCLLDGNKFMPELHLKISGIAYSACGLFTKHRERIKIFRETGNLKHIYKNELSKACFAHCVAYSDSKDLTKRSIPDKSLKEKAYEIAINRKYDGYQRELASMVHKFLIRKQESRSCPAPSSVNKELA